MAEPRRTPAIDTATTPVSLESIVRTTELYRRPARPPDYATENRALTSLAQALADHPRTILQTLADTILKVLNADSAGMSLLEKGGKRFSRVAVAGAWSPHADGGAPREFGPCGDVLDRNAPMLFTHWERRYSYLVEATPLAEEGLLVPLRVAGKPIGTLWAIAHTTERTFDAEDLRLLESLGRFASAAFQAVDRQKAQDSRRAALNLMEDAVYARNHADHLNAQLADEIANHERTAEILRESEKRYRALFASIDEGFCIIEKVEGEPGAPLDFRYIEANDAFEANAGVGGVVGKTIRSAFPGEPEEWYLTYDAVISTGEPIRFERDLVTQGRVLELYAFRVDDSTRRRVAVIFKDVTERKQAVEGLRQADRRKDEFLAMLGHELRNPLAPILTALELMKLRGTDAFHRERSVIERQVRHVSRLVDDMLDIARITRGKVSLDVQPLEVSVAIAKAIEIAEPLIDQRGHHLHVDVAESGLVVDADSVRLSQVFANLLTNAAKYSEPGGQIAISARREADDVVIEVVDTGSGLSPEFLPRVFDPFVQGARAVDRAQGGLGIGLSLVKNLVGMHNGSVSASSDGVGKGSRFTVRLPARAALDAAGERASSGVGIGRVETHVRRRVLLVDDNADAADILRDMLTALGHEVVVAYDGPQALATLERFKADLAIVDIGLPVMDGYELATRIRASNGGRVPRLIAVTGYGQPQDVARSRATGFVEHFVKPVEIAALVAAIEKDPMPEQGRT